MNEYSEQLVQALTPLLRAVRRDVTWSRTAAGKTYLAKGEKLTRARLEAHLNGGPPRGVAPMLPGSSTTRVAVLDLDDHDGQLTWTAVAHTAWRLCRALRAADLEPVCWRSTGGAGVHIHLLWNDPQDAYSVRAQLRDVLRACGLSDGTGGLAAGEVEVFPKQSEVAEGAYGNMFVLPLAGASVPLLEDHGGESLLPLDRDAAAMVSWSPSEPVPVRTPPPRAIDQPVDRDRLPLGLLASAVAALPNSGSQQYSYDQWLRLVFGLHWETGGSQDGFDLALQLSERADVHDGGDELELQWRHAKHDRPGRLCTGYTVLREASRHGWTVPDEWTFDVEGDAFLDPAADFDVLEVDEVFEEAAGGASGGGGGQDGSAGMADEVAGSKHREDTARGRLTFAALRAEIDGLAGPVGDDLRRRLLTRIAAARLEVPDTEVLVGLIRERHEDPAPTRKGMMDEIKRIRQQLVSKVSSGGEIDDIEMALIQEALEEHYGGGEHLRRHGRQYWAFRGGVWLRTEDEVVHGRLQKTLVRLRKERPADVEELVAAVGETKTSALTSALGRMFDRFVTERTGDDSDPLGLRRARPAIINCRNCEIHFDVNGSWVIRDHDPQQFLTSQVPVAFDPLADCPEWDRFCAMIFDRSLEPDEMQRHLEELGGYIIQPTRWLKTWVLLRGDTNAGKTTIGKVFEALLGGASVNKPMGAYDGSNSHAEAGLIGKLMLLDEDFSKGSVLPDGFIKKISESKVMTANPKNRDEIEFISLALPVVVSNHWPPTRDVSDAFTERALVWDFQRRITPEERSDQRADHMLNEELPGILRRFVEGFARLRARGAWLPPEECRRAHKHWAGRADTVALWAEECVEDSKGGWVPRSEAYASYRQWVVTVGVKGMGKFEFLERVDKQLGGPPLKRKGAYGWPDKAVVGLPDEF